MRAPGALLALLLARSVACGEDKRASAEVGGGLPSKDTLLQLQSEMRATADRITPHLEWYEKAPERYAQARNEEELRAAQGEIGAIVGPLIGQFAQLEHQHKAERRLYTVKSMTKVLFHARRPQRVDPWLDLPDVTASATFGDWASIFLKRCYDAQVRQDKAWTQANERIAKSRNRRRIRGLPCAFLSLAAILAAGFWRARSQARRAAPPVSPAASAIPSPPGGPGGLPKPGSVVGGAYRIVRELGRGSVGPCYEAEKLGGGRVVVKRVWEEFHRSERDLVRLLDSARRTTLLRHPSIAEVRAVFLEGERIFLAIEHVSGKTLAETLAKGPLSLARAENVLNTVCIAIESAHAEGLLHGRLHPGNILLSEKEGVKVTDFSIGLAAVKAAARHARDRPPGPYMAPEAELGSPEPASDIFSLGVLLYHMTTGRLPFPVTGGLEAKRAGRVEPPSHLVPGLPPQVDAVALKALAPDPARRFARPTDLFVDLMLRD